MSEIKHEQFSYPVAFHHYPTLKKERQFEAVIDYEYTDHGHQEIKYIALPPELFKHLLPVLFPEIEEAAKHNLSTLLEEKEESFLELIKKLNL